jgi:hypothetical protein
MANTEAMKPEKRRTGGWMPVAVALVAVGVFLGWLATQQPEETVAVEEPGAGQLAEGAAGAEEQATLVEPGVLVQQAGEYVGQTVELQSVAVMSPLGDQLFWIELPGGMPFLVKLSDAEIQRGARAPQGGRRVHLVGQVLEKNEAVLDGWTERGVLQTADQRMQAEYGTTYLEARRVTPAAGE